MPKLETLLTHKCTRCKRGATEAKFRVKANKYIDNLCNVCRGFIKNPNRVQGCKLPPNFDIHWRRYLTTPKKAIGRPRLHEPEECKPYAGKTHACALPRNKKGMRAINRLRISREIKEYFKEK